MYDLVVIGHGPAGISAALYVCRAGFSVLLLGKDDGALKKAHAIQNYYGLATPISGQELVDIGKQQARALGAILKEEEVLTLAYNQGLEVVTKQARYQAKAVLLATGAPRNRQTIQGLTELEGKGVSYCAVCDAFFYRGKSVCVLGNGDYALHEIEDLLPHASKVTLLTNGLELQTTLPEGVEVNRQKISSLMGQDRLEQVVFDDGSTLATDGLFVALGTAAASDLARKMGARVEQNRIVVDEKMQTNIPGLYAAGDCIGGILQIATAVGDGCKAGLSIIAQLKAE